MRVNVYTLDGGVKKHINLPKVFSYPYRPDLIREAVRVYQLNRVQPHGVDPMAGMRRVAESQGPGHGISKMVPRVGETRRGAIIPSTRGGRAGHPPTVEKVWKRKMNRKMRRLAKYSALSMVSNKVMVRRRGHKFNMELTLPVVIEDEFEKLEKTRDVIQVLQNVGVYEDIIRASEKRIRGGKGKMRGRRYKRKKSILFVIKDKSIVEKSLRNLPGVDVVTPKEINAEILAPGAHAGRLTVFTESAINELKGWKI